MNDHLPYTLVPTTASSSVSLTPPHIALRNFYMEIYSEDALRSVTLAIVTIFDRTLYQSVQNVEFITVPL